MVESAAISERRRRTRLVNPVSQKKALQVFAGTDDAYKLAKKYKIKTAFGTDILFDARLTTRQTAILAKMVRWYTAAETLKMATADNGQLMALSGSINPYPGRLDVVEEGALADLLLVEGNPLEDINLVADPDKNFLIIMKDGMIYKNTAPSSADQWSEQRTAQVSDVGVHIAHRSCGGYVYTIASPLTICSSGTDA